ncbi:heterokaryon incompatibility protein-domain-containing protein [Paraphoma chrysanthemicola]|nr:heterokaryon incompatibility protein-domain-containing protein [Paraphoma chrysanthemicola]
MLCQICIRALRYRDNHMRDRDPARFAGLPTRILCGHHRTVSSLVMSAEQGCQVCSAFWEPLSDTERLASINEQTHKPIESIDWEDPAAWFSVTSLHRATTGYQLRVYRPSRGGPGVSSFWVQPTDNPPLEVNESRWGNTGSNESWSLAMTWMKDCLEFHDRCNEGRSTISSYPTRLLDIGDHKEDECNLRLVLSASTPISGPYCTLSHCWGQGSFIQLNRHTADLLYSGIALDQLPKTFKEAIIITKRLGVQYIWIDSLCIMQDEVSDWRQEAAKMHEAYYNAFCNLSAAASANSSEGLFRDRMHHAVQTSVIDVCVDGLDSQHSILQCELHDFDFWKNNVSKCMLNKRGWVLQERLLAPRVLHFGSNQLLWECREHDACEAYPKGFDAHLQHAKGVPFKTLVPDRHPIALQIDYAHIVHWSEIVETYSKTTLTVPSDKLVALSGLASLFRSVTNDEYVAGLWRSCLEHMLLWFITPPSEIDCIPAVRPITYRAPSWSWASLDGSIIMDAGAYNASWPAMLAREVHLEFVTEDTTGAIKSGWLDLTGCLKPMRLVKTGLNAYWTVVLGDMVSDESTDVYANCDGIGQSVKLDVAPSDDGIIHADNAARRLYFMVGKEITGQAPLVAILLLRLVDEEEQLFERIGIAWGINAYDRELFLADLGEDVRKKLPCRSYENGFHTIRII